MTLKRQRVAELLKETPGMDVLAKGWVRTKRGNKNIAFIALILTRATIMSTTAKSRRNTTIPLAAPFQSALLSVMCNAMKLPTMTNTHHCHMSQQPNKTPNRSANIPKNPPTPADQSTISTIFTQLSKTPGRSR